MAIGAVGTYPLRPTVAQSDAVKQAAVALDYRFTSDDQSKAVNNHNSRPEISAVGNIDRKQVLSQTCQDKRQKWDAPLPKQMAEAIQHYRLQATVGQDQTK
jgi:hypothetical protein